MQVLSFCAALLSFALPATADEIPFDRQENLADWKIEYGKWQIADGALLNPDAGPERTILWRPAPAYADLDVSVRFSAYPDGGGVKAAGLVFKAASAEEYYYVHYDLKNSQVVWVRSAPGDEWTDARRHRCLDLKAETWHTARVVTTGSKHDVYLDDTLLFSETDDKYPVGVIGIRAGQGKIAFKDLKVEGTKAALDRPFTVPQPRFHEVCTDAGAGAYEAFPDVCRSKSGELLCVFYAGYGHVSVPRDNLPDGARIAMVRSIDNGRTWSPAETVVDSPIDDRDPSITQLKEGRLVVTYMSYDPKRKPATHEVFLLWSSDNGKKWGEPQPIETPLKGNEAVSEPVRELPDGTLLLPLYGALNPGEKDSTVVMLSRDGGKTWPDHAVVSLRAEHLHEPSVVRLPDGKLLMFIRPKMRWCESTDNGKTWSAPEPMPMSGDAPYPLLTSKGILLLAFRHHPTHSTSMAYSRDLGKTWSDVVPIDKVIGAYPSMVELPDGRILLVYYTEGGGSDIRCVFVKADEQTVQVLPGG
jgi:hypothetical protein